MFNYNKKKLEGSRKRLRNNSTPAEAALWSLIKNKQLEG
jgi:very-short-patch-repair endonuclease